MSDQELNFKFVKEVEKHEELYNLSSTIWRKKHGKMRLPKLICQVYMKSSVIYY